MQRRFTVAALALVAPLILGAGGVGHPPAGPAGDPNQPKFPNNTVFFVDDLQIVDDGTYNNFVRISLSPPPSPPAGPQPVYHTYFTIKADRLKGPGVTVAQMWIAMLAARLRDCNLGVEPKTPDSDLTLPEGDTKPDGTVNKPYELVGLSYGSLAGTNGQGECSGGGTRDKPRDDPHLGLYYGQTKKPA